MRKIITGNFNLCLEWNKLCGGNDNVNDGWVCSCSFDGVVEISECNIICVCKTWSMSGKIRGWIESTPFPFRVSFLFFQGTCILF